MLQKLRHVLPAVRYWLLMVLSGLCWTAASCDEGYPFRLETSPEKITAMELVFVATEKGDTLTYYARNLRGLQDIAINLQENTTYHLYLRFFDTSGTDASFDVTESIQDRADDHQVFLEWSDLLLNGAVVYNDLDHEERSLGLSTAFITGTAGQQGTLRIALRGGNKNGAEQHPEWLYRLAFYPPDTY